MPLGPGRPSNRPRLRPWPFAATTPHAGWAVPATGLPTQRNVIMGRSPRELKEGPNRFIVFMSIGFGSSGLVSCTTCGNSMSHVPTDGRRRKAGPSFVDSGNGADCAATDGLCSRAGLTATGGAGTSRVVAASPMLRWRRTGMGESHEPTEGFQSNLGAAHSTEGLWSSLGAATLTCAGVFTRRAPTEGFSSDLGGTTSTCCRAFASQVPTDGLNMKGTDAGFSTSAAGAAAGAGAGAGAACMGRSCLGRGDIQVPTEGRVLMSSGFGAAAGGMALVCLAGNLEWHLANAAPSMDLKLLW
mmetsp:Transcript_26453/g.60209  ORF Transcript_26453/g.60209 Transcript_26453/m.60209 type:complete len:300 (+) Transcript_26453:50-949(+)